MLLDEINRKMSVFRDCTLEEVAAVTIVTFLTLIISLSVIMKIIFGYAFIGMILTILIVVPVTKFLLARLQKLKFGKPDGYYLDVIQKKLSQSSMFSWIPIPYLQREGKWSVRRDGKKVNI